MSGKSWNRWQPVRVSEHAGRVWAESYPSLDFWTSYRRSVLSLVKPGDVEVTDTELGLTYCVDPAGDGSWVLKTIKGAK